MSIKNLTKSGLILFFLVVMNITIFNQSNKSVEHIQEPLKYEVTVSVFMVPLFALDPKGNPVYDLKQNELELYVNGVQVKIADFERFEFSEDQEYTKTIARDQTKQHIKKQRERVKFIIIDSTFNSFYGFRRSKRIAIDLIKESPLFDSFIILMNTPGGGLKYIKSTDESNRKEVIKEINRLKPAMESYREDLFTDNPLTGSLNPGIFDPRDNKNIRDSAVKMLKIEKKNEKTRYGLNVRIFSYAISQLKYALKTIKKPKIVFLISEGVARAAFSAVWEKEANSGEPKIIGKDQHRFESAFYNDDRISGAKKGLYSFFLMEYLKDIAKSINYGGAVLYTINPRKGSDTNDKGTSGEMSLNYMAQESGGKYFEGSNTKKIIKQIKKATAAYYNIAFYYTPKLKEKITIQIQCKRKGVKVKTLKYVEDEKPYIKMEKLQKKLFALNVVTGGDWSRMVGRVRRIKFKKVKKRDNKIILDIKVPKGMKNHKVDIYIIYRNPKTNKIDFNIIENREIKDNVKLNIKYKKKRKIYFVIIEPKLTHCLYNKIK